MDRGFLTMAAPPTPLRTTRVALIGAGFIARVHLQLLARNAGVKVVAICDRDRQRAAHLAARHGVGRVFASLDELLEVAREEVDAVHLLVPPPLHFDLAKQCLAAGLHVLAEKPLALDPEQARELGRLAAARGLQVGVNHNLTFHPGVQRLKRELRSGRLGRLEHLQLVHHVPLRQLDTGDDAHFMFQAEANILLEQGVHPFSVVHDLLGAAERITAHVGTPRHLPRGGKFFDTWMVALSCERGTAQVLLAFGRTMHEVRVEALCSDARVEIDVVRGTYQRSTKSRWLEVVDIALDSRRGFGLVGQGILGLLRYGLALFRLCPPAEPFLRSMGASLAGFHLALRRGQPVPNGPDTAAAVLRICHQAAAAAGASPAALVLPAIPAPGPARPGEVLVTGGTGFLGRHVVAQLLAAGRPVTVLVRRPQQLPKSFLDRGVRVFPGDATDEAALSRAAGGAGVLVHMATCAAVDPEDGGAMERAMAGSVATAAAVCRHAGVKRLIYVSSAAALYLGGGEPVAGDVDPDPQPAERPPYARGKIAAEHELRRQGGKGLETVCLRPGIVVGAGGVLAHTGVGLWPRDSQCVGWGPGRTPLPLVLAEDCADAILRAVSAPAAVVTGRRYNLAGDVRPTAKEYVAVLGRALGRPFRFHPQATLWLWAVEHAKHWIKRLARRPSTPPSVRDLRSRAFLSSLDTADVKQDLGWRPVADPETFWQRALGDRAPGRQGAAPLSDGATGKAATPETSEATRTAKTVGP